MVDIHDCVNHNTHMEIIRSSTFTKWMRALRDPVWKSRLATRLDAVELDDHFGDTKYLRDGIWELRFKGGAGFRVYYSRRGQQVVVLLCGGDKSSQTADIEKAIKINTKFEE